jgi:hypothetical protein
MTDDLTPEQVSALLDETDGTGAPMDTGTGQHGTASTGAGTRPLCVDVGTGTRTRAASSSTATSTGDGSSLPHAYANVRAARNSVATIRPLYGSEVLIKNDLGSFNSETDRRVALANYRHSYEKKNKCE